MGVPVERLRKVSEGPPERRRPDRVRRRRPRHQHPDRLWRARGRLRDPPRRGGARHPVHHHDVGRQRRAARDPRKPQRRHRGDVAPGAARSRRRSRFVRAPEPRPRGRGRGAAALRLTEPRTLAPPERRTAHVTSVQALGAYVVIRALDAAGPRGASARPVLHAQHRRPAGAPERTSGPIFRGPSPTRARTRASSASCSRPSAPAPRGSPSCAQGEGLELLGPLGVGWRPPASGTQALLVGGGIGVAPLLCLQDQLGPDPPTLLGFRSAAHAEAATMFAGTPELATDDGSAGRQALVTDLLRERLDRDRDATVFACGPPPMLEAVRLLCDELAVPAQLALESGMACGFGACFGCVVPTIDGYVRLCVDGPVLAAERLSGTVDGPLRRAARRPGARTALAPSTRSRPGGRSAMRCSSASRSTASSPRRSRSRRARATRRRASGRPRPG